MAIAASTEELLWNVSYQAMLETMLTRKHVVERHSNLLVTPATEHEETTTGNLLRHLGYYGQLVGALAVQHTRTLEGGLSKNGRQVIVPSGADLELAIEVSPGNWLDLLLQAKALKSSGTYSSWSPAQNKKLISWATMHGRTPGMILYNDLVPPFVATASPMSVADYECDAFGACPSVNRTQLGMWASSHYCVGPSRTPGGISLCLDQASMLAKPASPSIIQAVHFQLEHLLHTGEFDDAVDSISTTLSDLVQPTAPEWATELMEAAVAQGQEPIDVEQRPEGDRALEAAAYTSLVVPLLRTNG